MIYKAALLDDLRTRLGAPLKNRHPRGLRQFDRSVSEIPVLTDVVAQGPLRPAAFASADDRRTESKRYSEAEVRALLNQALNSILHDPESRTASLLDEDLRRHIAQAAQDAVARVFFDLREQIVDRVGEAMRVALEERLQASAGDESGSEDAPLAPLAVGEKAPNPL